MDEMTAKLLESYEEESKKMRCEVEQRLLADCFYESGSEFLNAILKDVDGEMNRFYRETGADSRNMVFSETHRTYTRGGITLLIVRIEPPVPTEPLQCRAVYLCFSEQTGKGAYFMSELGVNGDYWLCCRPDSDSVFHINLGSSSDDLETEFEAVLTWYCSLVAEEGIKQLEGLRRR